ncbi:tautomerase family protein [Serratia rubidaea]|uniref:tautomerase family protein n=1 Tax=Serratia rubidaea TaxID=61652 RepID=UPI00177F7EB1|nr:tautomerase family protein [Serratia rubidaea]MBD8451139.1 tautomerase family protein [Serratia rubidaea]MDC6111794.1 tautomerase family protein [Serratia rubidaea]MDC6120090.1 tautomerase family protein [Serratia rubidaea]
MPFTRITLRQGYSDAQLARLSDILHRCLTEEFAVPPDDRFQVIETLPANQRVFSRHYLSGARSDDFMLFQIIAGKPRTRTQKQNFYRALSERLQQELSINPDDVMVIVQNNQPDDWSFSNGEIYAPQRR